MKVNPLGNLRIDAEDSRSVNASVFKSYDIRGVYPEELNEKTAYLIGGAFVKYTNAKK